MCVYVLLHNDNNNNSNISNAPAYIRKHKCNESSLLIIDILIESNMCVCVLVFVSHIICINVFKLIAIYISLLLTRFLLSQRCLCILNKCCCCCCCC